MQVVVPAFDNAPVIEGENGVEELLATVAQKTAPMFAHMPMIALV